MRYHHQGILNHSAFSVLIWENYIAMKCWWIWKTTIFCKRLTHLNVFRSMRSPQNNLTFSIFREWLMTWAPTEKISCFATCMLLVITGIALARRTPHYRKKKHRLATFSDCLHLKTKLFFPLVMPRGQNACKMSMGYHTRCISQILLFYLQPLRRELDTKW